MPPAGGASPPFSSPQKKEEPEALPFSVRKQVQLVTQRP